MASGEVQVQSGLKLLNQKRGQLKAAVTRFQTFIKKCGDIGSFRRLLKIVDND